MNSSPKINWKRGQTDLEVSVQQGQLVLDELRFSTMDSSSPSSSGTVALQPDQLHFLMFPLSYHRLHKQSYKLVGLLNILYTRSHKSVTVVECRLSRRCHVSVGLLILYIYSCVGINWEFQLGCVAHRIPGNCQ